MKKENNYNMTTTQYYQLIQSAKRQLKRDIQAYSPDITLIYQSVYYHKEQIRQLCNEQSKTMVKHKLDFYSWIHKNIEKKYPCTT